MWILSFPGGPQHFLETLLTTSIRIPPPPLLLPLLLSAIFPLVRCKTVKKRSRACAESQQRRTLPSCMAAVDDLGGVGWVSNVGEGERSRPEPQRFGRFLGSPATLETLGKVWDIKQPYCVHIKTQVGNTHARNTQIFPRRPLF